MKSILQIVGKDYSKDNIKKIPLIEVSNINKIGYTKLKKIYPKGKRYGVR